MDVGLPVTEYAVHHVLQGPSWPRPGNRPGLGRVTGKSVQSQGFGANGSHPHETNVAHVPHPVDATEGQSVCPDLTRSGDNAGAEVVVERQNRTVGQATWETGWSEIRGLQHGPSTI